MKHIWLKGVMMGAAVLMGSNAAVFGATCTWIQTDTTSAQDWSVASNWQDGVAPSAGDDVVITSAANINFGGATVGSIKASADLVIDCNGGTLVVNGDVTGTKLTVQNTTVSLPAGDHVWTTSGDFLFGPSGASPEVYFVGTGNFIKAGAGTMQQAYRWASAPQDGLFQVPVTVKEGTIITMQWGSFFKGTTELTVDGPKANFSVAAAKMLGSVTTVKLLNHGTISVKGENSIEKLYVGGKQCAKGKWGTWNSTVVDYKSLNVLSYSGSADSDYLNVTAEPEADAYTADDFQLFTGETKVWTGAASTTWTDAANWQDGNLPISWDDIVISVDAANAPKIQHGNGGPWGYYHSITDNKGLTLSGRLFLSGDFTAKGGAVSVYPVLAFVGEGDHVIDNDVYIKMTWHSSVAGYNLNSEGNLIKRGTGKIEQTTGAAPLTVAGELRIEAGEMSENATAVINATNIVVTGESAVLTLAGAGITDTENSVVKVANGGKINLNGSFTQTVGKFYKDGTSQKKGRTYGSSTSAADRKDDTVFEGTGLLTATYDDRGTALVIRVQ